MNSITQSLLITAIGMGLVFVLILLLWGFMAVLVSLGNRWDFVAKAEEGDEGEADGTSGGMVAPISQKSNIVAIAVATALAAGERVFNLAAPTASKASAWQAVARANTLAQISSISNRKPRG